MGQDAGRREARVLAARRPAQVTQGLKGPMAVDDVDPVASLRPADERQHLVGRQVEWMEREPELRVLHQGKEAIGAVAYPFHNQRVAVAGDSGFHEAGPLASRLHRIACQFEELPIGIPRRRHGFRRVVKDVEVA